MSSTRSLGAGFTVALLIAGCSSTTPPPRPPPVSRTTTTSAALTVTSAPAPVTNTNAAASVSTASAVARLSNAHCDHVAACNAVEIEGAASASEERSSCMNTIGHSLVAAYPADLCAYGVSPGALAACKSEIDAQPCSGGSTASLEALPSCSRDRLCIGAF